MAQGENIFHGECSIMASGYQGSVEISAAEERGELHQSQVS